jgi:hypothetical protein
MTVTDSCRGCTCRARGDQSQEAGGRESACVVLVADDLQEAVSARARDLGPARRATTCSCGGSRALPRVPARQLRRAIARDRHPRDPTTSALRDATRSRRARGVRSRQIPRFSTSSEISSLLSAILAPVTVPQCTLGKNKRAVAAPRRLGEPPRRHLPARHCRRLTRAGPCQSHGTPSPSRARDVITR